MTSTGLTPTSDDLILYTITSDAVLRIFLPVLDAPEHLQLHASLDLYSSLPYSVAADQCSSASTIFWLDRLIVGKVIGHILKHELQQDDGRKRRIREIHDEGWDLFLRVLADGSIVVTALAVRPHNSNYRATRQLPLERRPPATYTPEAIYTTTISTVSLLHPAYFSLLASQL